MMCAGVVASLLALAQQTPGTGDLPELLRKAAEYVAAYELALSTIVSEENYVQRLRESRDGIVLESRQLRSDVLLATAGEARWLWFRDVFEVDGRAVRDRDSRLAELFLKGATGSLEHALRITQESARFNLGKQLQRDINVPTLPLAAVKADNQPFSTFTLERYTRVDGVEAAQIAFADTPGDRMVRTPDHASAHGRFWVARATGEVLKTEFELTTEGSHALIRVTYRKEPKLGLLVPASMLETYSLPVGGVPADTGRLNADAGVRSSGQTQVLEGVASYSKFRQFSVSTSIKRD